jgi:uroporphyrinogen-III synthase
MLEQRFAGKTFAVPESRSLEVFCGLLERRGATVVRCPLVSIHNSPDHLSVVAWVKQFIFTPPDFFVLLTGEGLRRIDSCLEQHAADLIEPFHLALAKSQKLSRGPKPNAELKKRGLQAELFATTPTTDGVIDALSQHQLAGRSVAVQLYGEYQNPPLIDFLNERGAKVQTVAPYIYADDIEEQKVVLLINRLLSAEIDVIAFTSASQLTRLWKVAKKHDCVSELEESLNATIVAAVGPVIRDALLNKGISVEHMPENSFFLKPLVNLLAAELSD